MPISWRRGRPVGAAATSTRSAAKARANPITPPVTPRTALSNRQPHRDVGASGAESRTNGQFLSAAFNPHQQQIGDVGAGNQQHHHNRSHEDPENISYIANYISFEGVKVCVDLDLFKDRCTESIGRWETVDGDRQQAIHIRVGLLQGHAGFEPGDSAKTEVAELHLAAIQLHGQEQRGVVVVQELEISRQYANDLAVGAINIECPPDDGTAAAEFLLPVVVGQNDRSSVRRPCRHGA